MNGLNGRVRQAIEHDPHGWLAIGVVGLLILVGIVAVLLQKNGGIVSGDATPEPTPVIVESTPTAEASPVPPVATPEPLAANCDEGCLVRLPAEDVVSELLAETGERPSYHSDDWLWSIVSTETVDQLRVDGVPLEVIQESPETLYLYATRLPEDGRNNAAVENFGDVLDHVDGHSIVRVEPVPARVSDLVNAGIWVEKLAPAAPAIAGVQSAGTGPPISSVDLGVLLPEVDSGRIEQTMLDMQGMSSTDGTGIGTRHYTTTGNVMAGEYIFTRLESYGLRVWYEDFITPEGVLSTNVIGEIPGRDSSMIYGVMAHYDSIAANLYAAPGADDNATGIASTLEIARILSGYELEHSVHFIFVNAEETAIIGSMAYARNAVANDVPLEGVFNIDTVGSAQHGTRIVLNADGRSAWMMDLLVRMNNGYGLGQEIWVRQNPAIIADDTMLRNEGLESVMVARELFGQSTTLHTESDVIDSISLPNTVSACQLVLLAVAALVQ